MTEDILGAPRPTLPLGGCGVNRISTTAFMSAIRTGKNVGFHGQVHIFLDDLFPTTIGKPLFSWR